MFLPAAEVCPDLVLTGLHYRMEELFFLASNGNLPLNVCSLLT